MNYLETYSYILLKSIQINTNFSVSFNLRVTSDVLFTKIELTKLTGSVTRKWSVIMSYLILHETQGDELCNC